MAYFPNMYGGDPYQQMMQQYAPPSYFSYGGPPGLPSQFEGPASVPGSYNDKDARAKWNSWSNNYLQPMLDYQLRAGDQSFTQGYNQATLAEQQWMNRMQNALAWQGNQRENKSLGLQEQWNNRDYAENVRRFNQEQALAQLQNTQQYGLANRAQNLSELQNTQQYGLAQQNYGLQAELGRGGLNLQNRQFAEQQAQNQRQYGLDTRGMNLQEELGRGGLNLQNRQFDYTQREGDRRFGLDQSRFGLESELGRGNLALQQELGRGQLGLDTRRFASDEDYRNRALQQEADLMKQRMANEMTQSRYASFGRSQAPNFRAMNSWR